MPNDEMNVGHHGVRDWRHCEVPDTRLDKVTTRTTGARAGWLKGDIRLAEEEAEYRVGRSVRSR
jgi:hypothetical protein